MRKILFSLGLVLGVVSASYAAVPVPTDKQNLQIANPSWAGVSTCVISNSTGTADLQCATGKGVVFGVIVSSGAGTSTDFVTLRDSATINHTSTVLSVHDARNTLSQPFAFPKFVNGLVATMDATMGPKETWTILYRLQSDQN